MHVVRDKLGLEMRIGEILAYFITFNRGMRNGQWYHFSRDRISWRSVTTVHGLIQPGILYTWVKYDLGGAHILLGIRMKIFIVTN